MASNEESSLRSSVNRSNTIDLGQFSYEDEQQGENKSPEMVSWRLDPEESFSDWIIEIIPMGVPAPSSHQDSVSKKPRLKGHSSKTYHVHKNILGAGKRQSQYFATIFKAKSFAESDTHTSRIKLESTAAATIPVMLDYIYGHNEYEATTENAVALHYLANYFGIKELFGDVTRFIKRSIAITDHNDRSHLQVKFKKAVWYHSQAALYPLEKTMTAMEELLAQNFGSLGIEFLLEMPADLFKRVLSLIDSSNFSHFSTRHLAIQFAEYYKRKPELVDDETFSLFVNLTNPGKLYDMQPDHALVLLKASCEHGLKAEENPDEDHSKFRERCVEIVSTYWDPYVLEEIKKSVSTTAEHEAPASQEAQRQPTVYSQLPDKVKIQLLESSLRDAEESMRSVMIWS